MTHTTVAASAPAARRRWLVVSLRMPGRVLARIVVAAALALTGGTAVGLIAPTSAFAARR